jgi:subtilisin family serine protease
MCPQQLSRAAVLGLALSLPFAASSNAQPASKIDQALDAALESGCSRERVIIRTRPGYRGGLARVLQEHGDKVGSEHPSIDAISADVHCEDIETLGGFDEVLVISLDAPVLAAGQRVSKAVKRATVQHAPRSKPSKLSRIRRPSRSAREDAGVERADGNDRKSDRSRRTRDLEGEEAARAQGPLLETLGLTLSGGAPAPAYTEALTAGGVGVAIIDSGIEPAPDFENRITHFYDFTTGRALKARPADGYGHGTHVAGLVASRYVGLAPNARLVGLRVLKNNGEGRTSDVISAIEFATANRAALGISVLNVSLGHPVYEPAATDPLVQAVEAASRSGLVVIAAAGNLGINPDTAQPGYAGVMSPGNAPSAITDRRAPDPGHAAPR